MLNSIFGGYDERKLKNNIRSALIRITHHVSKQTNQTKTSKREISVLIGDGKKEMAKIKCEHIIRIDDMIEAYGMLELFLALINERVHMVTDSENNKPPSSDLFESIASVIFGAKRVTQIEELTEVSKQLCYKYGHDFVQAAENNVGNIVNDRLYKKVILMPIQAKLLHGYMVEIARTYNVDYDEPEPKDEAAGVPAGNDVPQAPASNLIGAYNRDAIPSQQPFSSQSDAKHEGGIVCESVPNAATYEGEVNEMGQRHGSGSLRYSDGLYQGQFFKDMRHGEGTMTYNDKSMYIGDWWDDKRQGRGKLIGHAGTLFFDGNWWKGQVRDDRERHTLERKLNEITSHVISQDVPPHVQPQSLTQVPQVAVPFNDDTNECNQRQGITAPSDNSVATAEAYYTDLDPSCVGQAPPSYFEQAPPSYFENSMHRKMSADDSACSDQVNADLENMKLGYDAQVPPAAHEIAPGVATAKELPSDPDDALASIKARLHALRK